MYVVEDSSQSLALSLRVARFNRKMQRKKQPRDITLTRGKLFDLVMAKLVNIKVTNRTKLLKLASYQMKRVLVVGFFLFFFKMHFVYLIVQKGCLIYGTVMDSYDAKTQG